MECASLYGEAVIVIGDSHSMNLFNILGKTNQFDFLIGLGNLDRQAHNKKFSDWYLDDVRHFLERNQEDINTTIYHQAGNRFWKTGETEYYEAEDLVIKPARIEAVAAYLRDISKFTHTIWLGSYPEYGKDPLDAVFTKQLDRSVPIEEKISIVDREANFLLKNTNVRYVEFGNFYAVPKLPFVGRCSLYRDVDHLSPCGEALAAKWVVENDTLSVLMDEGRSGQVPDDTLN